MRLATGFPFAILTAAANVDTSLQISSRLRALGLENFETEYRHYSAHLKRSDDSLSNTCIAACDLLGFFDPSIISLPGSSVYHQEESRYWSDQQAEVLPACRASPVDAKGVAFILHVSRIFDCPFAVKSGGHAVVGGRVADIGVGGFSFGGGISFFSDPYGWACDNVLNYEVILANSSIVEVNYTSHPDLYYALRGGGNNFGIVTRFDLNTFEQGAMWGGAVLYNISANASIYSAFETFANNAPQDPDAALWTASFYLEGQFLISIEYTYAKPVVGPPIFQELTAIPNISSSTTITNMSSIAIQLNMSNPGGFRETYTTATFKNNAELQGEILKIFIFEIEPISNIKNILPAQIMQPITKDMISYFGKNGGNALGISENDGPLILMNLAILWSDSADDERILTAAQSIIDRSVMAPKAMNLDYRFVYQNYASINQDVFSGYGQENLNRLRNISLFVDPDRIFPRLQPGYFKLDQINGDRELKLRLSD